MAESPAEERPTEESPTEERPHEDAMDEEEYGPEKIEAFLAGRASEEEAERISDDLARDEELRARFLDLAAVEVLLGEHYGEHHKRRYGKAAGSRSRRRRVIRRRRTAAYPWFAAVAAVAAGVLFTLVFWPSAARVPARTAAGDADGRPSRGPVTGTAGEATVVARFTVLQGPVMYSRAGSGRWLSASAAAGLKSGDVVKTRSSRAAIALGCGSRVYMNHRTLLSLENGNVGGCPGIALSSGESYFEAGHDEKGLRVETPHGTVVDYGTRFGVSSKPTGTTVLVAEGVVEVLTEAGSSRAESGHELTLSAISAAPPASMPAFDIRERLAWTREVGAAEVPETGIVARRAERGLVALYLFNEGEGDTVHDTSGVGAPLDLHVADRQAVRWMPGALAVDSSVLIASDGPARKISKSCMASNEITIEAWVRPAMPVQAGPARVVTSSCDHYNRNFALAHGKPTGAPSADLDVRLRTTHTDLNGMYPSTASARRLGRPEGIVHAVYTRDSSGWTRLYIDNVIRVFTRIGGDFSNWDTEYRLALADEFIGGRAWLGEYHLVAVYARALTPREVDLNYRAGHLLAGEAARRDVGISPGP